MIHEITTFTEIVYADKVIIQTDGCVCVCVSWQPILRAIKKRSINENITYFVTADDDDDDDDLYRNI